MSLWIFYLVIICLAIILFLLTIFSILKQYRYATLLFDLLPFYPMFGIVSYLTILISAVLWDDSFFWLIPLFIGLLPTIWILYKSIPWINQYRLKRYSEFLDTISDEKYSIQVLSKGYNPKNIDREKINIFIQHDVDLYLRRLKRMLVLEKSKGIKSTSLFRLHSEKYSFKRAESIIQQLESDGFEIGYHYEVLAQTKGDMNQGKELFIQELKELRRLVPITMVEAHGDKYRNRKVWPLINKEKLKIFSVYDMKKDFYLSDAGGIDLKKRYGHHLFIELSKAKKGDIVLILIHADWWF